MFSVFKQIYCIPCEYETNYIYIYIYKVINFDQGT